MLRQTVSGLAAALALAFSPAEAQVVSGEVDLLEVHLGDGDDHLVLDSTFTLFEGRDRFVLKIEGGSDTRPQFDELTVQALYARDLSDGLQLMAGVRHDARGLGDLTHGALAFEAELTPWLSADHSLFVSEHGDVTGGAQIVGSWSLLPRLSLEPRVAAGWSAQSVVAEDLGAGLTDLEVSVRLRRAIGENFDIYAGVVHERLLGETRKIAVASGNTPRVTRAIIGAGFSF